MGENLLSLLHIQKLGHSIEEIRLRALSSVISKYNLNLVDEKNLENTKLLIENLLDWFEFEKFSEEGKVLNLLLKILKYENADLILKEIDRKDLLKRINNIEKKVGCEYQPLIQDIIKCIKRFEFEAEDDSYNKFNCAFISKTNQVNGKLPSDIYECHNIVSSSREFKSTETHLSVVQEEVKPKCCFKVELFPWQNLSSADKEVLSSVYDGLRYIDNKNSVLKACQFFNEVAIRDFPTEVFIQRPSIVKTFLQLIEHAEQDIRIPVIKCLIKTVECLKETMKMALNPALFHTKKEFYTTSVFPASPEDSPECFHLNFVSFDEDLQFEDNNSIDPNQKKYQLSVPQFCFEILLHIIPHLGVQRVQEETNCLLNLTYETMTCVIFNLNSDIWSERDLRNKFYKIFGKLHDVLKFQKGRDPIVYVIVLHFTMKLLNSLKPPSGLELSEILVAGLQAELGSCISEFVLVLQFPLLHSDIYKKVEKFLGQKQKDTIQNHKDVFFVLDSMKYAVKFLKSTGKPKTRMELLEWVQAALPSLDFHQNYGLVQFFVHSCLLKWRKSQLKEDDLKARDKILIKLLAHCNDFIKSCVYKEIHDHAVKLLGVEEAKTPMFDFPGDKLDFLFRTEVLTEIITHGLSSPLEKVRKYSCEIISNLLRSKFVTSEICWSDFISSLIPCLSLLQCYADKSTNLGRCIVKMFDPDVAKTNALPPLEILKGNLRFLYSKNNLTRDEGISRLFWLLSKEDRDNKKLPRMSVLTGLNLSGVCSCVKPQDYTKIRRSFYSPARLCDVMEMLSSSNAEPNLRRSALSQVAVMMDDVHLHQTFLEQKGLQRVIGILGNCLIEKEYQNHPDSAKPIIDILKALAFHNVSVRQDLSTRIDVLYNILRSLFLFSNDSTLRQNAVELLCLLLYSECILRVPSDVAVKCTISLPELVVNRMCLPFLTHIHWRNSIHFEPSIKKTLMSKDNCSKLIRVTWALYWVGSLSDLVAIQPGDLPEKAFSPGLPDDMKIIDEDVECLKYCSFGFSVKQTLYNIQNATTHEAVFSSLDKLHCYFLLYNIDTAMYGRTNNDVSSDASLSHMLWESTLERFMTAQPSYGEDEALLLRVIRLIQVLLKSFKSERLVEWVGKLLIDEHQPLMKLLKNIGSAIFGLVGKELRLAIIELTQQIVLLKTNLDRTKWFSYFELISDQLKLDKKNEFYSVAFVDWFLALLVDLTGKWNWNLTNRAKQLEKLITRLVEIIIAFHCTKDSVISFMGINIVKNALLCLNYLTASAQEYIKDWEKLFSQSLSKVIGQERGANYCWLLSLWFMRDAFTRGTAYALLVGFSSTSTSCDLLIDQLKIQFEHVWAQTFKTLFDENECSFVREKAGYLLSNLTSQGTKTSCGSFLKHLLKINFYQEMHKIISNYDSSHKLKEVWLHESFNCFSGHTITTPNLVTSVCNLLMNIISLNPKEVCDRLLSSDIIGCLLNVLGDVPEYARICGKHDVSTDVLRMYITVCHLLTQAVMSHCCVQTRILHSQLYISYFFSMINYNLFCDQSYTVTDHKHELWSAIFDFFSAVLAENQSCEKGTEKTSPFSGFIHINKCLSDNGIDDFISSLYLAMVSDDVNLRTSVFKFLINVLRHESLTPKHISIRDIFERKVSSKALKQAETHSWKALRLLENLNPEFGIRAGDVLLQIFLLSTGCTVQASKTTIADCLGSVLAFCKPAQDYCVEKRLGDTIISNLKQICVKLNLESVENLKKPSSKKKINPLLSETETLFRLTCNLLLGNTRGKSVIADCALSTVVFNLWPWCLARTNLQRITLKMLCTFTHSCDQACKSLTLSGSLNKLGLRKSPGSVTLMNAVMNHVSVEMDLISDSHDSLILQLCLQLLTNCCRATESRAVLCKGNFSQSFAKFHRNQKKRVCPDAAVESWMKFFIALSSHQDGQLALAKNEDLLEVFIKKATSTKSSHRIAALSVLRNICFHPSNRLRMFCFSSFLPLISQVLESQRGEEVQIVAVMIWALACNCQKAKLIMRNSNFDAKLVSTKRRFVMNEDKETADLIEIVLGILRNK